MPVLPGRLRIW